VSLFFGRNEACGLRCVYHGWKFDVDGNCVDMMNEPAELDFKAKIHLTAYPTVEIGGLVWAYLGPREHQPALPKFEWTQVAASRRHVSKVWQECNWLQALEGGIDTSHAPILHRRLTAASTKTGLDPTSAWVRAKAPHLAVDVTDYGYCYAGIREVGPEGNHIRAYHFVMPFHQLRPSRTDQGHEAVAGHIWVPMDNHNCMVYNWQYCLTDDALNEEDRLESRSGNGPGDVDATNGFRSIRHRSNNYLLDRQVQKYETFTGIEGINTQDRALQESMGPIVDRSKEHLGAADKAIIQARRLLLQAVKTVQEDGVPLGVMPSYYGLRAGEGMLPPDTDWQQILAPVMAAAVAK
jgi:phenylpropionate dioxygenase-like ring-hydroxylating dioxygenase large terminal subunit